MTSAPPSTSRRLDARTLALGVLSLAAPLCLALFVWQVPGQATLFALAVGAFPCALMLLGATRDGRGGPAKWPILLLWMVLSAVLMGLLLLRGHGVDGPWWGGLPAAMALQLYGLFVLPLCISSLGYAWTFRRWNLDDDALDDLRRRFPGSREPEDP